MEPFDLPRPPPGFRPGVDRLSIEVTQKCGKACWFCYSASRPDAHESWDADALVAFVSDCAANGVRAASFGGGEPLEWPPMLDVLDRLRGKLFRSFTTNGLLLKGALLDRVVAAAPDKIHVSIHFPDREREVSRVIDEVGELASRGIRSGVNLLVSATNAEHARTAAERLHAAGIGNDRIVYLPQRGRDTPTPDAMGRVAGSTKFQSMSCLLKCAPSDRFVSIGFDRSVGWCSYTRTRHRLADASWAGLQSSLRDLALEFCGEPRGRYVPLSTRSAG